MKILHRYVLKEHLGPALLGLLVFTFILLVKSFFDLTDLLIHEGVNVGDVTRLFLSLLPSLFSITVPMAILIAVLLAYGRLSADKEIIAIRTTGYNLIYLFLPLIIISAIVSGIMIFLNLYLIPLWNFTSTNLLYKIQFQIVSSMSPGRFYEGLSSESNNMSIYFDKSDKEKGEMNDIVIKYLNRKNQPVHIVAKRGRIVSNLEERNIDINLFDGSIQSINKDKPDEYDVIKFDSLTRTITPSIGKIVEGLYQKTPKEMTYGEIRAALKNPKTKDKLRRKVLVDLIQRFSIPLACITFVLIGIPLGIVVHPSGKSVGFGISFIMIAIYYWLLKRGVIIGKDSNNVFQSIFSITFPNILFSSIGVILMIRTIRK